MEKETSKKTKIIKIIILIITVALLIGLTVYFYPIMKGLLTVEGRENFKTKIDQSGMMGGVILLGLQAMQIILPVLPGEPIELLAGMCYGTVGGFLFILISALVVNATIFFTVRKFGRDFVYTMVKKEKIDKIEKSKLFKNPKKIEYIMLILFLLPGTPKDLLVYIAGLLPINSVRFLLISTLARIPSVLSSTLTGSTIVKGNWQIGIIMYAVIFIIVGIVIVLMSKLDKSNTTKEILEETKKVK